MKELAAAGGWGSASGQAQAGLPVVREWLLPEQLCISHTVVREWLLPEQLYISHTVIREWLPVKLCVILT